MLIVVPSDGISRVLLHPAIDNLLFILDYPVCNSLFQLIDLCVRD
jgi:hypothetical protein